MNGCHLAKEKNWFVSAFPTERSLYHRLKTFFEGFLTENHQFLFVQFEKNFTWNFCHKNVYSSFSFQISASKMFCFKMAVCLYPRMVDIIHNALIAGITQGRIWYIRSGFFSLGHLIVRWHPWEDILERSCISGFQHTLLSTLTHFAGHLHKTLGPYLVITCHSRWVIDIFKKSPYNDSLLREINLVILDKGFIRTTMPGCLL